MTKLEQLRRAAGMTQVELAAKANCYQQQITRLERGEREMKNASLDLAQRIAKALGIHVEDLLDES